MKKIDRVNWFVFILSAFALVALLSGCNTVPKEPSATLPESLVSSTQPTASTVPAKQEERVLSVDPVEIPGTEGSMAANYRLEALSVDLKVPEYALPLEVSDIENFESVSQVIGLSPHASGLLERNGFVVLEGAMNSKADLVTSWYEYLKNMEVPIFVTSDSLLHVYHIQFDETLRTIEEREFYDAIWEIDERLLERSLEEYGGSEGEVKEAAKKNVAYFLVALSLLAPGQDQIAKECAPNDWRCQSAQTDALFTAEEGKKYVFSVPGFVKDEVAEELSAIEKHAGFRTSAVYNYPEDYSQYVPRGHYTRSEKLKNYFKCFMWHGRISMLLKKDLITLSDPAAKEKEARLQTMGAALISSYLEGDDDVLGKWERIYDITAYYVGFSDDLGPYEYIEALDKVFKGKFSADALDEGSVGELKAVLAEYRTPQIYGGTGDCLIDPPFNPEQADECLEDSMGFRLMGQRFIPDSYMFQNLVFPKVGSYLGDREPFTMVESPAGPVRGFPRGLDVMAVLGSTRARELLTELDDDNYRDYSTQLALLEKEFEAFTPADWNRNLYWSWLYSLKALLKEYGAGYPTFMQTEAWQDKELSCALASWSQLRHDTILYAKQSYTPGATSAPGEPPKPVVGYVEPVPEFYNRLLALTRMTTKGLEERNVLDQSSKNRLESLENVLEKLVDISVKELGNEKLTEEDYNYIKYFASSLKGTIAGVEEKAQKTTIIADVHTDGNTGEVLEEGTGYVDLIVVAYKLPDGRTLAGAGPVLSYYEFRQPMSERLTDEKWREMLAGNAPEKPEWSGNYMAAGS